MKSLLPLLLCFALAPGRPAAPRTTRRKLPPAIRAALDRRYPGWKFPPVRDEVRKFVKDYFSPAAEPEFTSGDFDGNGERDYAALVEHGTIFDQNGKAVGKKVRLVAFMKRGGRYRFRLVDPEGGGEYVFAFRKGEKDYDYETGKNFTYRNDAIGAGIFEKAGMSYVYERGKFRSIITSD
jgi:hypothetical protein